VGQHSLGTQGEWVLGYLVEEKMMVDNDLILFEDAKDAAFALDKAYRRAVCEGNMDTAMELRPKVNEAYTAVSSARMNLLEAGVLATDADIAEMRRLKAEVDDAADTQQTIEGAVRIIGFLAKFGT